MVDGKRIGVVRLYVMPIRRQYSGRRYSKRVVCLIPELGDDMPSLALTPQFTCSGVYTSQTEVATLLTSFLAVALHFAALARIARF